MSRSAEQKTDLPGISLVIPTICRGPIICQTAKFLRDQDYPDWELVIVDQSDEVNKPLLERLADFPVPVRYYFVAFRGLPLARNFGWQHSKKDVVLYIDDDIECAPGFIRAHAEAHANGDHAFIAGGIQEEGKPVTAQKAARFNMWTGDPLGNFGVSHAGPAVHGRGCNISFKREILAQFSGFDEALAVGAALYEELEICLRLRRAGQTGWFDSDAGLLHLAAPTGGCRVPRNWPRYMFGLAHNRAIILHRNLQIWHWPIALARLLWLGFAYSRVDRSLRPLFSALRGFSSGLKAARKTPVVSELRFLECIRF